MEPQPAFNPFANLTPKQLDAFKEMKKNLSDFTDPEDVAYLTDMCILRYLRARNYTVSKSEKMLRNTLAWRKSYRPQDVKLSEVTDIAKTGAIYVNGKDVKGRPIIIARPRNDTLKKMPHELKFKNLVYWLEQGFRQMNESKGIETFCFVVDYHGFSRKSMDMKTNLESMHHLLDNCPERMGQSLFLDPPTMFWVAWKIISPFLNEVTLSKVKFIYSKKVNGKRTFPELSNYISPDQLEMDLGGENPVTFNRDPASFLNNPLVSMSSNSLSAQMQLEEAIEPEEEEIDEKEFEQFKASNSNNHIQPTPISTTSV
ncbi:cellular retinaldehyde-binding/triple function domain-containing protein [Heterostelium album PN500]|uniref:Cellular retinaldehyde-binding/triple function domain-containing protein n=1 Tax=Heterostelium pallidum (strain ATCC 26659 / Pp 5 / PN500) TaxID=670386 RepID=D3BL18_HETP5|nr:cellular retinaldehyde-binding/triple function domain-containing protein [Heterostelium album PN500]EFA77752.1 cellular retinaldehyde-binding/triple function domain-containing protein [Heterostelium album PN500]|eukprot:XP_020429880.1 cellular retinaldehyde-binding/triple function domain-containing protein [Heterostelium album PN500]